MAPPQQKPNLRSLREAKGLTRQQLVDAVPLNISVRTVIRWEEGTALIPERFWADLTEFFRVSVGHLLGWDEPRPSNGDDQRSVA